MDLGIAVCSQHDVVSRRLLAVSKLPEMDTDSYFHVLKGRPDRRDLYAHGLGKNGTDLRYFIAAVASAHIDRSHGA
jgi:hypothetical protein